MQNPKHGRKVAKVSQGDPDPEKNCYVNVSPSNLPLSRLRAPPKRWHLLLFLEVSSAHAHPQLFFTLMVPPPGGPSEMSGGAGIQKVLVNNRGTKDFLVYPPASFSPRRSARRRRGRFHRRARPGTGRPPRTGARRSATRRTCCSQANRVRAHSEEPAQQIREQWFSNSFLSPSWPNGDLRIDTRVS